MSSPQNIELVLYFKEQIRLQHEDILSQKRRVKGFVLLGITIILLTLVFRPYLGDAVTLLLGLGGGFFSTCAAFPYREINLCRQRIITYALLKNSLEKQNPSDEEKKQTMQLVAEVIKSKT